VEALLYALFAEADKVSGQAFNIGDGDPSTWRQFYQYFTDAQGLDLTCAPVSNPGRNGHAAAVCQALVWPRSVLRGIGEIVTSREFKALGRRILQTDPIGTVPRRALARFPALERGVRRMVRADDALPIYRPEPPALRDVVHMGSGGAVLSIGKVRRVLGFEPPVTRARALELTLDWVWYARIIGQ